MAVYKNSVPFGNIVTDGLVLNLDATNINSYPGSGTTWTDTSFYRNNGTLTNGPTFLRERGRGSIVFDGVDDFVNCGDIPFRFTNRFSIEVWFYWDNIDKTNIGILGKRNGSPYNQYSIGINNGDPYAGGTGKTLNFFARPDASIPDTALSYTLTTAGIYSIFGVIDINNQYLYANSILRASSTLDYTSRTFNITGREFLIGSQRNDAGTGIGPSFNNKIYITRVYNRALSAQEVQQNFNALKSRFGL